MYVWTTLFTGPNNMSWILFFFYYYWITIQIWRVLPDWSVVVTTLLIWPVQLFQIIMMHLQYTLIHCTKFLIHNTAHQFRPLLRNVSAKSFVFTPRLASIILMILWDTKIFNINYTVSPQWLEICMSINALWTEANS